MKLSFARVGKPTSQGAIVRLSRMVDMGVDHCMWFILKLIHFSKSIKSFVNGTGLKKGLEHVPFEEGLKELDLKYVWLEEGIAVKSMAVEFGRLWKPGSFIISCEAFDKFPTLSEPQFLHL